MPLATKDNAIIIKDGKLAENCDCCGPWYCYAPCLKAFNAPITLIVNGRALNPSVPQSFTVASNPKPPNYFPEYKTYETWKVLGGTAVYSKIEHFEFNFRNSAGFIEREMTSNAGSFSGNEVSAYASERLGSVSTDISLQVIPVDQCKLYVKTVITQTVISPRYGSFPCNVGFWTGTHVWSYSPVIQSDSFTSPLEYNQGTVGNYQQALGESVTYFYDWFACYLQPYPSSIVNKQCPEFSVSVLCDSLEDPRCITP
jgi:hypothetical protein